MKPATPILRNEHYLDVMTGGSANLPSPMLREERYLAKLAGMDVNIPSPVTTKEFYYAKICGMDVDVPTYTRNMPRIYAYMAKAAGQTIEELPTAVTREQRYWYDYVSEQPVTEHEYTGVVPYTFSANGEPLVSWRISGNTVQSTTPTPDNPVMPQGTGDLETVGAKAGQYKIPISSANTTTPVYLGEVQTTRQIKKWVLTGNETWYVTSTGSKFYSQPISTYTALVDSGVVSCACSHYDAQQNVTSGLSVGNLKCAFRTNLAFYIGDDTFTTPTDFKAYLAQQYANGTPVCVWYVLATPETAVVNEPLMRIGEYADEVANVATIPTNNGSTTIDVETAVKPSEVYIKWKGV